MEINDRFGFEMERRLYHLNPELHTRFRSAVFALQHFLTNYTLIFPEYTDHSSLHSLTVVDFCNRLIGDRLDRLNADELYVLLAAKMQKTLDTCRTAVLGRTPYVITQQRIELVEVV